MPFKKLFVILSVMSLTACQKTIPNGKLISTYTDLPVQTEIVNIENEEKPLSVVVPAPSTSGVAAGGLIGALVVATVATVEHQVSASKRMPKLDEIIAYTSKEDVMRHSTSLVLKEVKNASWISVQSTQTHQEDKVPTPLNAGFVNKVLENPTEKTALFLRNNLYFTESFDRLVNSVNIEIYDIENGKIKNKIYNLQTADFFMPSGTLPNDLDNNYKLWMADDGKIVKRAIQDTGRKVQQSLKTLFENPIIEEEKEENDDKKETVNQSYSETNS